MCGENSLCRIGRGPAWGWAASSHAGNTGAPEAEKAGFLASSGTKHERLTFKVWGRAVHRSDLHTQLS
jgi:hypothetical protein